MSETLVSAMYKSPSAEHFIDHFLLPAYRNGRLPSARTVWSSKKKPLPEKWSKRVGAGDEKYRLMVFTDRNNPHRLAYFKIAYPMGPGRVPFGSLFFRKAFLLSQEDYSRGKEKFGSVDYQSGNWLVSKDVLIPKAAIAHWDIFTHSGHANDGSINVGLDSAVMDRLIREDERHQFLDHYISSLNYAVGRMDQPAYSRAIRRNSPRDATSTWQAFFSMHGNLKSLLVKLGQVEGRGAIADLLVNELKIGKGSARRYATTLGIHFKEGLYTRARGIIAEHALMHRPPENPPFE